MSDRTLLLLFDLAMIAGAGFIAFAAVFLATVGA